MSPETGATRPRTSKTPQNLTSRRQQHVVCQMLRRRWVCTREARQSTDAQRAQSNRSREAQAQMMHNCAVPSFCFHSIVSLSQVATFRGVRVIRLAHSAVLLFVSVVRRRTRAALSSLVNAVFPCISSSPAGRWGSNRLDCMGIAPQRHLRSQQDAVRI